MVLQSKFLPVINSVANVAIITKANSLINVFVCTHNSQQLSKSESARHKDVDYTQHITLALAAQRSSNRQE